MKKDFVALIGESLRKMGIDALPVVDVEVPPNEDFGDLSTPVAMSLSKILRKSPKKIAEEIASHMTRNTIFERVDIASPGFINIAFTKEYLCAEMTKLLESGSGFLREKTGRGRRIQIEFISANPTGPLHLGHGRGGAIGDALANLLKAAGYHVEREYYINDAGKQIRLLGQSVFARYQQLLGVEYPAPEEGYKGGYIEDIAREIAFQAGSHYVQKVFDQAADFFIDYSYKKILSGIRGDLNDFGIAFDSWQSERELFESSEVSKAIEDLQSKGFVYEKEQATWFRATAFGDDKDRVIIKQDGEYTYFTSDIAYHRRKIEKNYDELIDIWGADHHGYIPRMQAVIGALGYPKEKLKVLLVQMVTLLRGGKPVQMSKRAGEFVTLREVIEEVGADTTKFIFLTRRPDSHLEFDLEVAKTQSSENPVFYVQYAHARINSIFAHAREKGILADRFSDADLSLLSRQEELRIIKKLLIYPMVFEGAVKAHEPHRITFYVQELSSMFHPYYNKCRIVTDDSALSRARLALCEAIRTVLRDGLEILGISAPERM
ncbi:MAG: arginine--tRNA ligase [Nitrospira bacterium SM23_35]|nr:MAG: arginine--tRNA ligase [Nitrospira bacterium SM23_35]